MEEAATKIAVPKESYEAQTSGKLLYYSSNFLLSILLTFWKIFGKSKQYVIHYR